MFWQSYQDENLNNCTAVAFFLAFRSEILFLVFLPLFQT